MMNAAGIEGGYWVYRVNPRQVQVGHPDFLAPVRMNYFTEEKRLVVERRPFSLRPFLSGMHTRGGYDMGGFWDSVWAVFVDVVSCRADPVDRKRHLHVVEPAVDPAMGMARARSGRDVLCRDYRDALMFPGRAPCTAYSCLPSPDAIRSMSSVRRT